MPNQKWSVVESDRLLLIAWTLPLIDAFIAGSKTDAEAALNVTFREPFAPPPETADVFGFFRKVVESDTSDAAFVPRLIVRKVDRMAVGSIGLNPPDPDGISLTGYSVYPAFEGNGYASEAARALCDWGIDRADILAVKATIPLGHTASEIVASRAGLSPTGELIEGEGVTLGVWIRYSDQSNRRTTP